MTTRIPEAPGSGRNRDYRCCWLHDVLREIFKAMLACRNRLGLLSEDVAPATRELWVNFPQTCSMVGVVNGAARLSRPWDDVV